MNEKSPPRIRISRSLDTSAKSQNGVPRICKYFQENIAGADGARRKRISMLRVVQENSTMSVSILQYGHGYNPGGILPGDISPTITTSSWEHNNFLLKPIMKQSTKTPPPIPCNDGGYFGKVDTLNMDKDSTSQQHPDFFVVAFKM